MTRKEYLIAQKEAGKNLLGVFPAQYPKEILWAMNVVPAEIWDPPLEVTAANAHLQAYICSVVKLGLELVLQGKCDFLDGFLFPHTCDSIQNMASVISDFLDSKKPCYFFYHPKAPYGDAARKFYRNNLKDLVQTLEKQFGPELDVSNEEFYKMVRRGEYMFPDDLIPELEGFLAQYKGQKKDEKGPSVILSGVLPNPPEILSLLDDFGVKVAHDDFLIGSRRLLIPKNGLKDPFEQLTAAYFTMPPCSTRGSPIAERLKYLLRLIDTAGAKAVIFNVVKFCEPEWFDIPNLRDELKKRKIPSLVLDTEVNQGLSGQMKTRLEAFSEIIIQPGVKEIKELRD
jgi:benzoyl-CoA reductase/2-hydroxyglutaryl-CoA dehydratase subunit BcrC/BadD/HgdB